MNFRKLLFPIAGTALYSYGQVMHHARPTTVAQAGRAVFNYHREGFNTFVDNFKTCLERDGFYAATPVPALLQPVGMVWDLGVTKPGIIQQCGKEAYRKMIIPGLLVKPVEYIEQGVNILKTAIPIITKVLQRVRAYRQARA